MLGIFRILRIEIWAFVSLLCQYFPLLGWSSDLKQRLILWLASKHSTLSTNPYRDLWSPQHESSSRNTLQLKHDVCRRSPAPNGKLIPLIPEISILCYLSIYQYAATLCKWLFVYLKGMCRWYICRVQGNKYYWYHIIRKSFQDLLPRLYFIRSPSVYHSMRLSVQPSLTAMERMGSGR